MCKYEEIEGWRLSNGKTIRKIKKAVHEKVNLGEYISSLAFCLLIWELLACKLNHARDECT